MHYSVLCAGLMLATIGSVTARFSQCFPSDVSSDAAQGNLVFPEVDRFGLALFRNLASTSSDNLMVSPFSVWSALSLALIGAQGNTKTQLEQALGLPSDKLEAYRKKTVLDFIMRGSGLGARDGPEMRSIDYAYFDQRVTLRPCVKTILFKVDTVDFRDAESTALKINADVSHATGGEITDFLKAQNIRNAEFVLINAIYFKGQWESEFDPGLTREAPFRLGFSGQQQRTGRTVNVPMMKRTGLIRTDVNQELDSTFAELTYRNSNISMFVMLPNDENRQVEEVIAAVTGDNLRSIVKQVTEKKPITVILSMPKFDLKTRLETPLRQSLEELGMTDMFDASRADFGHYSEHNLFISSAITEAKVRVDEEGTVASAATGLIATRSGPGRVIAINLDRPFAFFIYDKRLNITLFAGIVNNPIA